MSDLPKKFEVDVILKYNELPIPKYIWKSMVTELDKLYNCKEKWADILPKFNFNIEGHYAYGSKMLGALSQFFILDVTIDNHNGKDTYYIVSLWSDVGTNDKEGHLIYEIHTEYPGQDPVQRVIHRSIQVAKVGELTGKRLRGLLDL